MTSRLMRTSIALAAVTTLALSGCGTDPGTPAKPAAKGGSAPAAPAPALAEFTKAEASLVKGLEMTKYSDTERKIEAEVPVVPGARTLSSAMEVVREHVLRGAAMERASEVSVASQVLASGPDVVGVEISSKVKADSGEQAKSSVVWYDGAARRAYSSPAMIDSDQWGAFKQAVAKAAGKSVDAKKLSQALDSEAAPMGDGPSIGFSPAGDVVLRFAAGTVSDKEYAVTVPAAQTDSLLSAFGIRARTASTKPSAFDPATVPPAASAPSSAPKATSTPGTKASGAAGNAVPRPSTAVGTDCTVVKCVALTFDDGPGPESDKVVKALVENGAAGTFFQLGQAIKANPKMAKDIASAGMEVGSHTVTHQDLARSSAEKITKELDGSIATMTETYGRAPLLLRPPYGSHNKASDVIIGQKDMAIIQWSNDTNDWKTKSTTSTEAAASAAKPNDVVLMHDIHDFTVAAVPGIVRDLKAKGLTMVTISELSLNSGSPEPGHAYCSTTANKQTGFACAG